MVFLYFVLPVFFIWLLQHYHSFSLSNKWLVHVPACFAALDNWFWFFLFYFQSSIPDFTVTSSCTESSFSPSPGELIYYPQNSLCFHENCWGTCNFMICYGNRTEWSPIRSLIIRVINKIGRPRSGSPICLITSMITDRIGRHDVLLPINHNFNKMCDIIGYF